MFTGTVCAIRLHAFVHRHRHLSLQKRPAGPPSKFTVQLMPARSHNSNLVGDLESVVILGQDNVGLLLAAGGDKSVDLADFD